MKLDRRKDNPNREYIARYDPVTGEIQGLIPGTYIANCSVTATPEIVSDPRQWRYDFTSGQMVRKPQAEIDEILRTREEGKIKAARKEGIFDELDSIAARLELIEQRLKSAGL